MTSDVYSITRANQEVHSNSKVLITQYTYFALYFI